MNINKLPVKLRIYLPFIKTSFAFLLEIVSYAIDHVIWVTFGRLQAGDLQDQACGSQFTWRLLLFDSGDASSDLS